MSNFEASIDNEIIEFDKETSGQGVFTWGKNYPAENNVLIFNMNTVEKGFNFRNFQSEQYDLLKVFKSTGTDWSFVRRELVIMS